MDRTGEEMDGLRALADVACAVAEGASGGSAGAARVLGPDLTTPRRVAGGGAEDEGEAFTAGAAAAGGVQRPGEYPAVWGSQPPGWQQNLVCNSDKDSDLRCFFDAIDDCFLLLASRKTALGATAKAADWQAQDGCSNKTHPVGLLRVKGVTTDPRHNPSVFHAIDALVCAGYGNAAEGSDERTLEEGPQTAGEKRARKPKFDVPTTSKYFGFTRDQLKEEATARALVGKGSGQVRPSADKEHLYNALVANDDTS